MKSLNHTKLKLLTFVSFICLLIPSSILGLWIYVCAQNVGTPQPEIVAIFKDYFPNFLHGRWDTTLLSKSTSVKNNIGTANRQENR
jgi:hypothetical protein